MTPPLLASDRVVRSPAGCPADETDPEGDLEGRWVAWLARGHASDVRLRRRMTWAAWLFGIGIVSWPAWAPALLDVIVAGRS